MKLALHRSLIFWAGLLVIAFTCWAWWDSCSHSSMLSWKQCHASSEARGIIISRRPYGSGALETGRTFVAPTPYRRWPREFLPPPFLVHGRDVLPVKPAISHSWQTVQQHRTDGHGPGSWTFYLPYWLILLALPVPWSLALLWRARRLKRATGKITNHQSSNHQSKCLEE
jgi:hypothetical protein